MTPEIDTAAAALTDAAHRLEAATLAWPPARRTVKAGFAAYAAALADVERWLYQLDRLGGAEDVTVPMPSGSVATPAELASWAAYAAEALLEWTREDGRKAETSAARSAALARSTTAQRRAATAGRRAAKVATALASAQWRAVQDALAAELETLS